MSTSTQHDAETSYQTAALPAEPQALRDYVAIELRRARQRTAALTGAVDDEELVRQHSTLMSPLVWDYAHIGNQEEQWLVREVGGRGPLRAGIDELYDAFRHPRTDRPELPLLDPDQTRAYVAEVREQALDVLAECPLSGSRLTDQAFAFGMIAQHEQQHDETMLATHQLRDGPPVLAAPDPPPAPGGPAAPGVRGPVPDQVPGEVFVPGGTFTMGTSTEPWALDNERPAHQVSTQAFLIDTAAVTNAAYAAFIADGGYDDPRWWSGPGWQARCAGGLGAPRYWWADGARWMRTRFGVIEPVPDREPVMHVCYYEAEAYARWAGKRLPSEAEWEKAARYDPATGRSLRYPWGDGPPDAARANLAGRHLRPAEAGAYPAGASPLGVRQLIGDVWEWTSSDFAGYPGFAAFPYAEYSEVFFGATHKVLRGGSFGTDTAACRATFRNWDFPLRRQIFAGFRCARDPQPGEIG